MKVARGRSHVWLSLLLCNSTSSSGTHPACVVLICPLQGLLELSLRGLMSGAPEETGQRHQAPESLHAAVIVLWPALAQLSVKVGVCWVGKILPYTILQVSRQLLERCETAGQREGGSNSTPALGGHSGRCGSNVGGGTMEEKVMGIEMMVVMEVMVKVVAVVVVTMVTMEVMMVDNMVVANQSGWSRWW